MRRERLALLVVVASGLPLLPACSLLSPGDDPTSSRLCTPGSYVFCRCADRSEGTKLCRADGASFEACRSSVTSSCDGVPDASGTPPAVAPKAAAAPPSADRCPGKAAELPEGRTVTLAGDTTTATGDRRGDQGPCGAGAGARDHVYHLLPAASGELEVEVEVLGEGALVPLAYVRTTCAEASSQIACATTSLRVDVRASEDYFLVIDGADGSAGAYTATLTLTPHAFCGDAHVDPGEACDDGNDVDRDGCDGECARVDGDPAVAGTCDGQPVAVWPGHPVSGTGSTAPYSGSGAHVYSVSAHASGSLVVELATSAGATLARRTACATSDVADRAPGRALAVPVTDGENVWIAIENENANANANAKENETTVIPQDYAITFTLE